MKSVELFAGAGGLALGSADAGFNHLAVVEWDSDACDTIRENQRRGLRPVADWPLHQIDAREFDYSAIKSSIDLLVAGPPCQPFSLGGKHRSIADNRNMFPEVARALRELRPNTNLVDTRSKRCRFSLSLATGLTRNKDLQLI